jgi:NRPS condensation-like uncharacterized protein
MLSSNQQKTWFKLDNAAKIFPAITKNEITSVFRLSVELKETIKIGSLQKALEKVILRFPYYKVQLRIGFFWYYLEDNPAPVKVILDNGKINSAFSVMHNYQYLFRVLARRNQISVEFLHILTDGTGALEFLKCLMATYVELCNQKISDWHTIIKPWEVSDPEEAEDGYFRYFNKAVPGTGKISKAFHLPSKTSIKKQYSVIQAITSSKEIIEIAKKYQVSVSVFLTSVYLFSLQAIYLDMPESQKRKAKKIIRIQIPVNLRKIYPSKTMRNFSLYIMPEIDLRLGEYSFDEILKTVYHYMHILTDRRQINKMIVRNVGPEKNIFIRIIPVLLKNILLSAVYRSFGIQLYSGVLTNLGKVELPEELSSKINFFSFVAPPPAKELKVNLAVISYGDLFVMNFGNNSISNELEKRFLNFLTSMGLKIKLKQ